MSLPGQHGQRRVHQLHNASDPDRSTRRPQDLLALPLASCDRSQGLTADDITIYLGISGEKHHIASHPRVTQSVVTGPPDRGGRRGVSPRG